MIYLRRSIKSIGMFGLYYKLFYAYIGNGVIRLCINIPVNN